MPERDTDTLWLDQSTHWRRAVLFLLPAGVIAFLACFALERPSFQANRFDLIAYPFMAGMMLLLIAILGVLPRSLRLVITTIVAGTASFFSLRLAYLVFFAATPRQFQLNMTEGFYWVPIIYLLSFLVPGMRLGKRIATVFTGACVLLSSYYILTIGMRDHSWGVIYALIQFNMANAVQLALTSIFIRFKDSYTRALMENATNEVLALTDHLTGLPNRLALETELNTLQEQQAAIFFIDLDNFKLVNDTFGHSAGDLVLKETATRLQHAAAPHFVARLSGDEFIVLVKNGHCKDDSGFAKTLHRALDTLKRTGQPGAQITASIGVSLYPDHGRDIQTLLRHADSAMFQVKRMGKNGIRYFDDAFGDALERERQLEMDLTTALTCKQISLYYQPIVDLLTGNPVKVEALARWQHPQLGWVSPTEFIATAERTGFIVELGTWVMQQACRDLATLQQHGWQEGRIAVNVSPLQFNQANFLEVVSNTLTDAGLSANRLELEVTESVTLTDPVSVQHTLTELRRSGVSIALDDFGTGYSSLSHLRDLPLDTIKIDRGFIANLTEAGRDQFDGALVEAAVKLADKLDLSIVAEGIEDCAQRDLLTELGADLGQGYHFAKPLPLNELISFLALPPGKADTALELA